MVAPGSAQIVSAGSAVSTPVTGARRVIHDVAMPLAIALPEARNALSRAADRWADLFGSLADTHAPIPGSTSTVGDAAAHVVMDLRTEAVVAAGQLVSWAQGATSAPGTPHGVAELNARAVTRTECSRDAPGRAQGVRLGYCGT